MTIAGKPDHEAFDRQVLTLFVASAPGAARVAVEVLLHGAPGYVLTNLATA